MISACRKTRAREQEDFFMAYLRSTATGSNQQIISQTRVVLPPAFNWVCCHLQKKVSWRKYIQQGSPGLPVQASHYPPRAILAGEPIISRPIKHLPTSTWMKLESH